ncbi:MAG: 2-polyprenyl-6-methoxyphenol hydroxylase-like FAD-dependent oxidoreductase [Cellvibrionaceae bacterium]|jgi:2-polyprenyl-6-methoxyphenol hydroxylase-like FAD-dependent oxidoreductase
MNDSTKLKTDVLIVGAGPVGLTLAIDLAQRGVQVTVAELRHPRQVPTVRCNHISARSMEIFRRLGVAQNLRNAGLPETYPHDASFRTTVIGKELSRIHIPGRATRYSDKSGPDGSWLTPEPPQRLNQLFIEPIMFDFAAAHENITLLNRTEIGTFAQSDSGVIAQAKKVDTGETFEIESRYLVGCDGGRSGIRKQMGANFVGDAVIQRVQSTDIRAPKLLEMMEAGPAWGIVALNPRRSGTLYAIDGKERWIVHNYLRPEEEDFESIDRDWSIRTILGVDADFEYETLNKEDWIGRRLVADKLRNGRVFICGDSAHIWVPYGGYGMNAGIADAASLAWLMAADLNGWGGPQMLDAYEKERLPITEQVSRFAMNYAGKMIRNRRMVPSDIEAESELGDTVRAEFGQELYDLNVNQYCCEGLNFGYFYNQSPLIVYDGEPHPVYTMGTATPSTVPGCRLPHFWLADADGHDRSIYDLIGSGYALLCFDPKILTHELLLAAKGLGLPLKVIDVDAADLPSELADVYQHKLTIVRPDQHVAWRGDGFEGAEEMIIRRLCGGMDE